ncbi:MAG: thermonuclease family protein [Anaerolineales bacterium]|nr:thermonuclease family protein [Anaerolineales bacterium]MCS7248358.1 thermonuclease family protein [Anaerolineales bacterium]MDW8162171.1 thermonuclease family protein [Anaerolineales bacterium]MDW8446726.1 thermonuclease family protein [Anaerolineales bacterium]
MKRRSLHLFSPLHRAWSLRLVLTLALLGGIVLACNFSQFLPAATPQPGAIEATDSATELPTSLLSPAELLSTLSPSPEPTLMPDTETTPQHRQYLPLLSGDGAIPTAEVLAPSPTLTPASAPHGLQPTSTSSPTLTAQATPTSIPLSYLCIPPQTPQIGLVTKVIDGDTLRVLIDGREEKVRYIGVDAPESTTTQEPFGKEAARFNAQLVRNQIVELYRDVSETDRYGRLLRYVVTPSVFVNLELIEEGYATAVTYPPDVACAQIFQQAERTARMLGKGLWALLTPTASP